VFFSPKNHADQWTIDANIQQALSYNDNVRMSATPQGSMLYTLTPVVNFSRKTDNSSVSASASYGIQHYSEISSLNRTLQDYHLNSSYSTERSIWSIIGSINVAPSYNTASMYSGNFSSNSDRTTIHLTPSVSYKLTELDTLRLNATYAETNYTGTDFNNTQSHSINLDWQSTWTERFSNSLELSYSNLSSNIQQSDTYNLNLGVNFTPSEKWVISGKVGGRFTSSISHAIKQQSEGFLLNLGVIYTGELLSSHLSISRSLLPSGQGTLQQQNSVNFDLNYPLSTQLSAAFTASYLLTDKSNIENQSLSRQYIMLQPSLNWKIAPDWMLAVSYQYRSQSTRSQINNEQSSGISNSIMLSINYNWQGLSFSR
jgi:hypothetical protein